MTVLVFSSAAAGAGIVAPDLGLASDNLGTPRVTRVAHGRSSALLAAHRRRAKRAHAAVAGRLRGRKRPGRPARVRRPHLNPYKVQTGRDFLANVVDHPVENLEALQLVFGKRVFLRVMPQVHSLAQGLHILQMIQPLAVDRVQIAVPDNRVKIGRAD